VVLNLLGYLAEERGRMQKFDEMYDGLPYAGAPVREHYERYA